MRIDHWLLGCCDFCVKEADTAAFLNVCRAWAIPYEYQRHEDGAWHFRCRARAYAALERQLAAVDVDAHLVRRSGLPALLVRHRRRVGVLVGALVAAVVCYLASAVVWDVRIESEGGVDAVSLEETLRECGLSVGTFLPSLDTDEVESRLLTTSRDVAWVSVNIKGTVAYVQVYKQVEKIKRWGILYLNEPRNLLAQSFRGGVVGYLRQREFHILTTHTYHQSRCSTHDEGVVPEACHSLDDAFYCNLA